MKVHIPGFSTMTGSPITILKLLQDARFFKEAQSLDDYIVEVQQMVWRIYNLEMQVTGSTTAERAESLLRELNRHKLLEMEDDNP